MTNKLPADNLPKDYKQRILAIDVNQSILLQAPAGSGKTEILGQRILALLAVVELPEQILALTFTNKAANEMRTRVLNNLLIASQITDGITQIEQFSPHRQQTLNLAQVALANNKVKNWDLINNPYRLQIKTIDAFNLSLVSKMPLLSKTGGLEKISLEPSKIYLVAINNTLAELETDSKYAKSVYKILQYLENNSFTLTQLLMSMLAKRDQWLRLEFNFTEDENLNDLRASLELAWLGLLQQQIDSLNIAQLDDDFMAKFKQFSQFSYNNLSLSMPAAEYSQDIISDIEWIKIWQNLVFTKSGSIRKTVTKTQGFPVDNAEDKQIKIEFLKFLEQINPQFIAALALNYPIPKFSSQQWDILQAMFELLTLTVANLQLEFIKLAEVDFTEISLRAIDALSNLNNNLALYLDYKISHILIDEFQDTNYLHLALLQQLTCEWGANDGKTFFAVGDPMQSIYRFREADVGLFLRTKENGIGNIKLKFLQLSVNFRSQPAIINWINDKFKRIFPPNSDVLTGAVNYNYSDIFSKSTAGKIDFNVFVSADNMAETEAIIKTIQQTKTGTIGILVRKRTDLLDIAVALKQAKIEFRAVEIDSLQQLQIVDDLRNIIKAFGHLKQRGAWLAVLRAPYCGLSLVDLQNLVDIDHTATIWQLLQNETQWQAISTTGIIRLRFIKQVFTRAFALRTQFPLATIIAKLWVSLGGRQLINHEYELIAINMVWQLVAENIEFGGLDFTEFDKKISQLFAPANTKPNINIDCMTIHKAKGLEFDWVILPRLNGRLRPDDKMILNWAETTQGLLLAPIKPTRSLKDDELYNYLSALKQQKNHYENTRLLYVACTRARKNLYLFATIKPKSEGKPLAPSKNSHLDLLWDIIDDGSIKLVEVASNEPELVNKTITVHRFSEDFYQPAHNFTDYLASEQYQLPLTIESSSQGVGIIFHLCCEYIAKIGVDNLQVANLAQLVTTQASQRNLPKTSSQQILLLLENMLADITGRWILSNNHSQAQYEWEVSYQQAGEINHRIIDRAFVEHDIMWIIDYKTSSPMINESTTDFSKRMLTAHHQQLIEYKKLVSNLTDLPIKLMLYLPAISQGLTFNTD